MVSHALLVVDTYVSWGRNIPSRLLQSDPALVLHLDFLGLNDTISTVPVVHTPPHIPTYIIYSFMCNFILVFRISLIHVPAKIVTG